MRFGSNLKTNAKQALWRKFEEDYAYKLDDKGYVRAPEDNVLPGINFARIRADLERGSGNELDKIPWERRSR